MQALILDMIKKHPGITDAELAELLYTSPEDVRREAMRIAPPVYRFRTRSPDGWVTSYSTDTLEEDTQQAGKPRQEIKSAAKVLPPPGWPPFTCLKKSHLEKIHVSPRPGGETS